MGRARAIGIAWAALVVASPPAVAPLWAAPEPVRWSDASAASLGITLDTGAPAPIRWIEASLLAPDPFARPPADAIGRAVRLPADVRLEPVALASVPEPTALLGLTLGLAGLSVIRRRARAGA